MNPQIHSEEPLITITNAETATTDADMLVQEGFTSDEILSLLWLRQWYQNGGSDRTEAIRRLQRALTEYYVSGIQTNLTLFRRILASPDFEKADIYTRWLDDFLLSSRQQKSSLEPVLTKNAENAAILAAALWQAAPRGAQDADAAAPGPSQARWKIEGRHQQVDREPRR